MTDHNYSVLDANSGWLRARRRGVALMLVVVAMGTATVMTTAYLLSKDNSAAIGANAQDTAASEWAARSGADLALAILQTDYDWVDTDPAKLLQGFTIAGGTVSVALCDLDGKAPIGEETELAMTVVADVNGVKTVLQRIISMRPNVTSEMAIDGELREFGVFAQEELKVENRASIMAWPLSPEFKSGKGVVLGAGFVDASNLDIQAETRLVDTEFYVRPDSTLPLQSMTEDPVFVDGAVLDMVVPAVPPVMPSGLEGLEVVTADDLSFTDSSMSQRLASGKYAKLQIDNLDTVITLDDTDGGKYLFEDITINNGSVLLISGSVIVGSEQKIVVENAGTIVFADDASRVRFYVGNQLKIHKAAVGLPMAIARDADREIGDVTQYSNPERLKVFALSSALGGDLDPDIDVYDKSIACMVVHAPLSQIEVRNDSWVIGRLTGNIVKIKDDSGLMYDPILNQQTGFTTLDGPLYKSNGDPIDGLVDAINSYDNSGGIEGFELHLIGQVTRQTEVFDVPLPGAPDPRDASRAIVKPWPFVAMAIEEENFVPGDNTERQESLYVGLDDANFDLDQFYDDGVIVTTYTKISQLIDDEDWDDVVEEVVEVIEEVGGGLGGIGGVGGVQIP